MVLTGRVSATGHGSRPGSGVLVTRSQKDYMEQHILARRQAESQRAEFWGEASQYWGRVERQAERFSGN